MRITVGCVENTKKKWAGLMERDAGYRSIVLDESGEKTGQRFFAKSFETKKNEWRYSNFTKMEQKKNENE